ncbi:hypothetical protein ILUMI_21439 [Ignelater luminosus]|uniref:PiggyBac transposable element-derived protein domain-containing protein n=1 Tax=Ignelater luminosus TaxID=2038154 RepID=A0A8K0G3U9_IGNLU|nr:hypothetical protein ILUMI_21439 [Ignelater luminosus]
MASVFGWRRPLSTAKVIKIIMENLEEIDVVLDGIVIIPPEDVEDNTDCDSADEETNNHDNSNNNPLTVEGEFYFENNEVRPPAESHEEGDHLANPRGNPVTSTTHTSENHSLEFFQLILCFEMLEDLVKYSCMYVDKKRKPGFELSTDERILLPSGYVSSPRRRMYWEKSEDVHNQLVKKSVALEMINSGKFPNVSIDEAMIPYCGRHGCKQYIRGKPIRFKYKTWVAALMLGYCLQFEIYQERKTAIEKQTMDRGESVVFNFAKLLQQHQHDPHQEFSFYFDNFFSSAKLIRSLGNTRFGATRTVRENRMDTCPLKKLAEMKRLERSENG